MKKSDNVCELNHLDLLCNCGQLLRYHQERSRFIHSSYGMIQFLSFILISSVTINLAELLLNELGYLLLLSGVNALVLVSLVFNLPERQLAHKTLYQEYLVLNSEVSSDDSPSAETLIKWNKEIHSIGSKAPSSYHALMMICWNEACQEWDVEEEYKFNVPEFHKFFRNFYSFEASRHIYPLNQKITRLPEIRRKGIL